MRVTCKHCGGAHPAFECRKKSTAARTDVPFDRPNKIVVEDADAQADRNVNVELGRAKHGAGTQALPVDTKQGSTQIGKAGATAPSDGSSPSAPTKFDRKAWMREYQRNYMRNVYRPKLKASKSNPNTPERNDK